MFKLYRLQLVLAQQNLIEAFLLMAYDNGWRCRIVPFYREQANGACCL